MGLKNLVLAGAMLLSSCAYQVINHPQSKPEPVSLHSYLMRAKTDEARKDCWNEYRDHVQDFQNLSSKFAIMTKLYDQPDKPCQYNLKIHSFILRTWNSPDQFQKEYEQRCDNLEGDIVWQSTKKGLLNNISALDTKVRQVCPQ